MRLKRLAIIILLFAVVGCHHSKKLKLATSIKGAATEKLGKDLADYLNAIGWDIKIIEGAENYSSTNITAVIEKEVDLAFIQNDQAHTVESNEVQTVLPFFPNISYIFYRNFPDPKNLEELITNNSVLINEDDEVFYKSLFTYYGVSLDAVKFNFIEFGDSVDEFISAINKGEDNVICVFAAIHNPYIKVMNDNDWEIFSLGDITYSNRGSSVEGFCLNYPRIEPFIVPRNFFGKKPTVPIYTIAMEELLITHEDVGKTLVYDLVNDIYEGKHFLTQQNILFTHISENFNEDALNFPLLKGTINYLERDEPSFFERYAEAFGVLFSILVVMIGALTSLKKIRKERIDTYYKRVMRCHDLLELENLLNEAVNQLQREKLAADESFTIFLNLVEKRRYEIENNPVFKK